MRPFFCFACLIAMPVALPSLAAAAKRDESTQQVPDQDVALEQRAGVRTQPLQSIVRHPEFRAYGKVLSLEPLVNLRQQYLAAQAQRESAEARYRESEQALTRTRRLHDQDIVSTRRLQEQQTLWRNTKADLVTRDSEQQNILATSRLQWGDTLTDWFTRLENGSTDRFLNHQARLLLITLPPGQDLPPDARTIAVDEHGRRNQAREATLISAAPQVDPVTQSKRYYFISEGQSMPFGAHVSAWVTAGHAGNKVVVIPEAAVVWHLGQAFVFIKSPDGAFTRRQLREPDNEAGGYFAENDFQAGEEIVVNGAQTLLSQELKNLIPDEDDD